jgi:hypothetical protein
LYVSASVVWANFGRVANTLVAFLMCVYTQSLLFICIFDWHDKKLNYEIHPTHFVKWTVKVRELRAQTNNKNQKIGVKRQNEIWKQKLELKTEH